MKGKEKNPSNYFSPTLGIWFLLLISNNLVLPVFSTATTEKTNNLFEAQKNFFPTPDPYGVPTTPSGFHSNPSHSPSTTGQSNCNHPTPSGGGGHYYPSPSPSPPRGGGHYYPTPTPTTPSHGGGGGGGCQCPSPPPSHGGGGGGGGGYYRPPSPTTPGTPLVPSPPYVTPGTPIVPSPPLLPVTPTPFDPNTPPFPCTYWGSNPTLVFGVLGWWATVGGLFGVTTLPALNAADYSLQQVLTSPRRDGYGSLYREATASLLNSMATKTFPFSTKQVKDAFLKSLSSDKAAADQARLFKLANEGKLKHIIHVAAAATTTTTANTNHLN